MSILAPGGARARRLSSLLASTALVSVAALSMSVTDASAACTVTTTGTVDCLANTTTTNTINTNGATAPSSDKLQEFDNGSNITGTIANGVTVDGFGLQLSLTNAARTNTIGVTNSGTVTTNQSVNALELNGNGGLVSYIGSGTVSTTAGGGNAHGRYEHGACRRRHGHQQRRLQLLQQSRPFHPDDGGSTGTITVDGSGTITGGSSGIYATADGAANINITSGGAIAGGTARASTAASTGGNVLVATGSTVSGGTSGISATTIGTGTVTVTTGGAVTGTTQCGILTTAANGNTTVNAGHDVTAGTAGIRSTGLGSGLIDINHTAGTIAAGTIGIVRISNRQRHHRHQPDRRRAQRHDQAVSASTTGSGNVIVSLTGGTVGNVSGNVIETSATTGTTTITSERQPHLDRRQRHPARPRRRARSTSADPAPSSGQ